LKQNKHLDIGINVLLCENGKELSPIFCSKNSAKKRISLLLAYETDYDPIGHYMLITDFNNLAKTTYKDSNGSNQYKKHWFCFNCLNGYTSKQALENHTELCNTQKAQKVILPNDGECLFFKDYEKTYLAPLVGFLDFESFLTKSKGCVKCKSENECIHNTKILNKHTPFSWSLVIIDMHGNIILQESYVGLDCGEKLIEYLLSYEDELQKLVKTNKPLKLSRHDEIEFNANSQCVICFRDIDKSETKILHHHHYDGTLIGPSHNACNVNCPAPTKMNIYVHNLAAYDAMFIIQALAKIEGINYLNGRQKANTPFEKIEAIKVKVMPHNTERVRTISINMYTLLDSMDLFHASLASLVDDLNASNHNFPILEKSGIYRNENQRKLLLSKGVYPYAFGQTINDLVAKRKIPHRKYFYSDISSEAISDESYQHALTVFETFNMSNMLEYSQLYCRLDTLLLAECVMHFRHVIYKVSKLDCCAFLSAAHLALNMFLKITGTELELLTQPDQVAFIQNNIRGGLSFVNKRFSEKTDDTSIIYTDQNNLYGLAQCSLLPLNNFRWLNDNEKHDIDWKTISTNDTQGYIVECTLKYPKYLHKGMVLK
jgi:hypothetical protein